MGTEQKYIEQQFNNRKGERRKRIIEADTHKIVEDFHGYGAKLETNLDSLITKYKRKYRRKFCRKYKELIYNATSAKDVEKILSDNGIAIPFGLSALSIYREKNKMVANDKEVAEKGYYSVKKRRKHHPYIELHYPNGLPKNNLATPADNK